MANITITIPDNQLTRVLDAIATLNGYQAGSGQTKAQFARTQLIQHVTRMVRIAEEGQALEAAKHTALNSLPSDVTLS